MAIDVDPAPRGSAVGGPSRGAPAWSRWLSGVVAAAVALGVAELLAGLVPWTRSPVSLIGARTVDLVPAPVKDAAIALLGTADKAVLLVGIVVVALLVGAALGVGAARSFPVGGVGFAAFAALGVLAAGVDAQASALGTAAAVAGGALGGLVVLRRLLALAAPPSTGAAASAAGVVDGRGGFDRRVFVRLAATSGLAAALAGGAGTAVGRRSQTATARAAVVLPRPASALPPAAAGTSLDVPGISPLLTPNHDFYRIDTALTVPRADLGSWRLRIDGMVSHPFSLAYQELLALPMVEADVTIACVSNEVGGNLIGTARWLGVPLADLLQRAGAQPTATQVVGRSLDGWTAGFPTAAVHDGRDALVAVAMNGQPLPLEHGFPARLVVPGLYGYVSATKWLASIELTTWEAFDGYWVPRGWAKEGPIKTQSRIDVPRPSRPIPAGPTAIAGVAWAPGRGIDRVEVRIDRGPWQEARLADPLDDDTWRQWALEWEATPGRHVLEVRATDGDGRTQTEERRPPAPDGASGWHRVRANVDDG